MDQADKEEAPLEAEAAKREEWRGRTQLSGEESAGHLPPASESDPASDEESPSPRPRTIAPPD